MKDLTQKIISGPALKVSVKRSDGLAKQLEEVDNLFRDKQEAHDKELADDKAEYERKREAKKGAFAKERAKYEVVVRKLMSDPDFHTAKKLKSMKEELEEVTALTKALRAGVGDDDSDEGKKDDDLGKPV